MNGRPRITVDWRQLRNQHAGSTIMLPAIDDEFAAAGVVLMFDALVDNKTIVVPRPYRLSLLNDDEADITGMIVNVERIGAAWPYASDGWADIDNYLPRLGSDTDPESYEALETAVNAVIGRADRCIAFLHMVGRAFELVEQVADGNSEYDTLSEKARGLLTDPTVRRR